MKKTGLTISRSRFQVIWMVTGAVIGWAAGTILGLNLGLWYFVQPGNLIFWQVISSLFCMFFYTFLMTSSSSPQMKGAILGMGILFSIAVYGGEIWAMVQDRPVRWITSMTVAEGIFYEWLIMHSAWLGIALGWIIGAGIERKQKKLSSFSS